MSQPLILQHVSAFGCNIRPFSVFLLVHLMGCCAEKCLVATGEIRSIGETHEGCNLCHTALAFGQQLACGFEARVAQQFYGAHSCERLALAEQLGAAQADVRSEKLDGVVLVAEVPISICVGARGLRQAPSGRVWEKALLGRVRGKVRKCWDPLVMACRQLQAHRALWKCCLQSGQPTP